MNHNTIARPGPDGRRKRKHESNSSVLLEEIAWTATRCFRLLRSIESRIAVLRRLSKTSGCLTRSDSTESTNNRSGIVNVGDNEFSRGDPVWLRHHENEQNSELRTYNLRKRPHQDSVPNSNRPSNKRPSNIKFPSPLLRRIRANGLESDSDSSLSAIPNRLSQPLPRKIKRNHVKHTSEADEAEGQLETALANVLVTTQISNEGRGPGARSLKSLCCRQVYSYIQLDNEIANANDKEADNECTFEIYEALEALGPGGGSGWHELRQVVRAHTVGLICGAIDENLLSSGAIERFVGVCGSHQAIDEGQKLLSSWLPRSRRPSSRQLHILDTFCKSYDCYGYLTRMWYTINSSDPSFLHAQLRQPEFDDLMLRCLMEISNPEASMVLHDWIMITDSVDRTNSRILRRTGLHEVPKVLIVVTRLSIIAAAFALLPSMNTGRDVLGEHIFRAAFAMQSSSLDDTGVTNSPKIFIMAALLLMSLQPDGSDAHAPIQKTVLSDILSADLWELDDLDSPDSSDDESTFARDFASGILSLENYLQIDLIQQLITRLTSVRDKVLSTKNLLKTVKFELAIAASRSTYSKPNDPAFMTAISKIIASSDADDLLYTPNVKAAPTRQLRWEESICEWMLITPLKTNLKDCDKQSQRGYVASSSDEDQLGVDDSSPNILSCTPHLQHDDWKAVSPTDSLSAKTWLSPEVQIPARSRSRESFADDLLNASPDVITMPRGQVEKQRRTKMSRVRPRLNLSERSVSFGKGCIGAVKARPKQRRVRITTLAADSSDDELGR